MIPRIVRSNRDRFATFRNLFFGRRLGCVIGGGGEEPIRQRQFEDGAQGQQVLASQRTGRIRQVKAGAHRLNPLGDLA